jgi:hypothetical protein
LFHAGPAHGVHPSGPISTRRAVRPLGRRCPPEVGESSGHRLDCHDTYGPVGVSEAAATATRTALRTTSPSSGLCSLRVSASPGRLFRPTRRPRPSWVSSSLGGSPSSSATLPRAHPLMSFTLGAQAKPNVALQSVRPTKRSAGLPRACRPFRGLPPCRYSSVYTRPTARGRPSETACCYQQTASRL